VKIVKNRCLVGLGLVLTFGAHLLRSPEGKPAGLFPHGTSAAQSPAPDFSLIDLSGNKLDLASYRGKVVLLNFWATWCGPCRTEIPRFISLQNKYRNKGLQIVGISLDDDAKPVHAFYRQLKMNYPVAMGDAGLAERYGGILGLPVSFVIGCDGRIYARHTGEVDVSLIEQEILPLLQTRACTQENTGD
jgi:cytochrome c biogenesis protein CcmG/thiol:disulfide interchange protein DsbE